MDIHKPKPWHSAREFLKEYVIIVVGVLTALAAESGVEWLHWRHLAAQHAEELDAGARTIAINALQRLEIDGCLRGGFQGVVDGLRRPGAAWRGLNPSVAGGIDGYLPRNLFQPQRPWPYAPWESALGDGSLTHLPAERLRAYTGLYRTSKAIAERQQAVADLVPELTPLALDQTLTAQDKARYLTVVARLANTERQMVGMERSILTYAADNGLWPSKATLQPFLAAIRVGREACVRDLDRKDFEPGGALVMPLALRKR